MRVNIKDKPGLQRDLTSGAVINTDNNAFLKAVKANEMAMAKDQELLDIKNDGAANGHYLVPFEFSVDESFMVCITAVKTDNPNAKIRMFFF